VMWAPYVFDAAREYGLVLMESGRLIDTTRGEEIPEDEAVQQRTTATMMEKLQQFDSEALQKIIVRTDAFEPAENGLLAAPGVSESPIIGLQHSEAPGFATEAGPLGWQHGFQLKHLKILSGQSTVEFERQVPEVLLMQSGHMILEVGGEVFEMAAGDVFTVPVGLSRQMRNEIGEDVELYTVLGTDRPTASLV